MKAHPFSLADMECTWCQYIDFPISNRGEKHSTACRLGHFSYCSDARPTEDELIVMFRETCKDYVSQGV